MHTLLILAEQATQPEAGGGSALTGLLPLLIIGVIFYFLIIAPQRRRQQQQRAMVSAIGVHDRIVTIGGFHGTVLEVSDDTLRVELAPGVVVTLAKAAVARRLVDADDEAEVDLDDELEFDEDQFTEPGDEDVDLDRRRSTDGE